jgi:hypothetical protein
VFKSSVADGYPWSQPYGMSVTAYGDVLIGLVPMLHLARQAGNNSLGTMDVQLVVSRDGRQWNRVAGGVLMDHGLVADVAARPWDARVYPSTTMFVKDNLVHIYYSGTNHGHGESLQDPAVGVTRGIGLATLPADRFVAMVPEDPKVESVLETRALHMAGRNLLVNAQVEPGELQIEVCDEQGAVVPGFSRQQCVLTVHDSLRFSVHWRYGDATRRLQDAMGSRDRIRLRFILRNGALYAFQAVS